MSPFENDHYRKSAGMNTKTIKKGMVLAGDIGGTKTNLGLYIEGTGRPLLKKCETYSSRGTPDLESLIAGFLEVHPAPVLSACFGIAGPVMRGESRTTNLPWHVSEPRLKRRFKWPDLRLINDLTATAQAVPLLKGRDLVTLNETRAEKRGNLALIAPGTGLGQALLIYDGARLLPVPSEGGHVEFAPANEDENALWRYLHKRFGHVSIERVLSGPGLVNVYSWLRESGRYKEPPWLSKLLEERDPARVISETALKGRNRLCAASLKMFTSILGAVCGNVALTGMATGGVYLGGGIPPKILPVLKQGSFMKAFTDKGRFSDFMKKIPVRVILNDRAALLGAARCALDLATGCRKESQKRSHHY